MAPRTTHHVSRIITALLVFIGCLALSRVLYEGLFPYTLWLARPGVTLLLALIPTTLAYTHYPKYAHHNPALLFSPLLLNLPYLFNPEVNLLRSQFLLVASGWLLVAGWLFRQRPTASGKRLVGWLLTVPLFTYLLTMSRTVGQADTFEFQVVIPQLGIVHPTGYPLYLLLGKLFTFIPFGSVAWRINFASVVFAMVAIGLVFWLVKEVTGDTRPGILSALLLTFMPTFWSQAIEAEVYALHAVFVASSLLLMWSLAGDQGSGIGDRLSRNTQYAILFTLLGFGLTNHLTTLVLVAPAGLILLHTLIQNPKSKIQNLKYAFLIFPPLILYAYLPLRWAAVNGEPMGFGRFVDWVIGGRFQDALQLGAWLNDPTRYEVVGRLFLNEWQPPILLLLIPIGLIYLAYHHRFFAFLTFLTWLGYSFYSLSYYVPDLNVFLLPAQLVMAIWAGVGLLSVMRGAWYVIKHFYTPRPTHHAMYTLFLFASLAPVLFNTANHRWSTVSQADDDGQIAWGQGVLDLPLDEGAAILADSDKFPPLYYLQQAEGIRPDLDIMVLPDEAAYRAELTSRLANGQTVYLARFLPGLEGLYHLRSVGPLTEVSNSGLEVAPAGSIPSTLTIQNITLLSYTVEHRAAIDPTATALTLYWQTDQPIEQNLLVYTRWEDGQPTLATGQHPANNDYPTVAWRPGEVVTDFHLLPRPVHNQPRSFNIQVALAPPFTPAAELDWQTVTLISLNPPDTIPTDQPLRMHLGTTLLKGITFPSHLRPDAPLSYQLVGYATELENLSVSLLPVGETFSYPRGNFPQLFQPLTPFFHSDTLSRSFPPGRYNLIVYQTRGGLIGGGEPAYTAWCGWFQPGRDGCIVGQIEISGVPLPDGAINFADQIALLELDVPETTLRPGEPFPLTLSWQSLAPISENYTVFVQLLDVNDQIVRQIDAWPLQGTYPTSQWAVGEIVHDPYLLQLPPDLPAGQYRLQVGWYLLATLERLPVLNETGNPVDDKHLLPGLATP